MNKAERLATLAGLVFLVAFLASWVFRLPQLDITLILLGGLGLATCDSGPGHLRLLAIALNHGRPPRPALARDR